MSTLTIAALDATANTVPKGFDVKVIEQWIICFAYLQYIWNIGYSECMNMSLWNAVSLSYVTNRVGKRRLNLVHIYRWEVARYWFLSEYLPGYITEICISLHIRDILLFTSYLRRKRIIPYRMTDLERSMTCWNLSRNMRAIRWTLRSRYSAAILSVNLNYLNFFIGLTLSRK